MRLGILKAVDRAYDRLERHWDSIRTQRGIATVLVVVFLASLVVIELRRQGWLPAAVAEHVPTSHFYALHTAFTLLLLVEVIGLVFGLAQSVASAAGKQFEIMSLILIRQSFKELTHLPEPIEAEQVKGIIHLILSDAIGALLIFLALMLYYRLQRHRPITDDEEERASFVATKKLVALLMLVGLVVIGADALLGELTGSGGVDFFEAFYTLLVFADVLLVLVSMRYSVAYHVVFRYFGFAVATVLVRLALTAPRIWDAALGLTATLFAVGLSWAYNLAVAGLHAEEGELS